MAEKLNDDLVFVYVVTGDDDGELSVRIPNGCQAKGTPFKQTTCNVTSILVDAGAATADNDQGKSCGVPEGKCGFVSGNYCEVYACAGTVSSCTANLLLASFSFDVAVTPNADCANIGTLTDETSVLAVGTPSGTPGGMSSCCNVPGKPTNAPAVPGSSASRASAFIGATTVAMAAALVF